MDRSHRAGRRCNSLNRTSFFFISPSMPSPGMDESLFSRPFLQPLGRSLIKLRSIGLFSSEGLAGRVVNTRTDYTWGAFGP